MSADALEKAPAQTAQLREERNALARDLDAHLNAERLKAEKLEFGMTPSSRSRCTVAQPDGTSPYAKFVKKT